MKKTRWSRFLGISLGLILLFLLLLPTCINAAPWKFIMYGDTRSQDDIHRQVLQSIIANSPDYEFIINVGDLTPNGMKASNWDVWQAACDDILGGTGQTNVPPAYMAAPGNHESLSKSSGLNNWINYLPGQVQQFGNNGRYFVFDYNNARFIVLDSYYRFVQDPDMNAFFTNAVQTNTKEWLFTVWHNPIFNFSLEKVYEDWIHDNWGVPLYQAGADIMFVGHAHFYLRTKKVAMNGEINPPLDPNNGTAQIVTGNGGAYIAEVTPNMDNNGYMVETYISDYGYTELVIDGNNLHIRHILRDGTVFDEADYVANLKSETTTYQLNVNEVGSGIVVLNPSGGTYIENTNVTLTANPSEGWVFDSWSGDLNGSSNPETVLMNSDKNVTATFAESGPPIDEVANADIEVLGTIIGNYISTQTSDDTYESIEEILSGGPLPKHMHSALEHKWTINVTGGSAVTFYVEAYHTVNSEKDDFIFAYSTDDVNYTDMVTITKTVDDDTYQTYSLPNSLSGQVYIRISDANHRKGNLALDTIYIDHMFVRSVSGL